MSLLSNLLATAFAGLLYQDLQVQEANCTLTPWTQTRFRNKSITHVDYSDHLIVVESEYKHGTSLPPWTDGKLMFLPFEMPHDTLANHSELYRGRTKALSSEISCNVLTFPQDFSLTISQTRFTVWMNFNFNHIDGPNQPISYCNLQYYIDGPWSRRENRNLSQRLEPCESMYWGFEIAVPLQRATGQMNTFNPALCPSQMVLAWVRLSERRSDLCHTEGVYNFFTDNGQTEREEGQNTRQTHITMDNRIAHDLSIMACRAELVVQDATIEVDSKGYVQYQSVETYEETRPTAIRKEPHMSFSKNQIMQHYLSTYRFHFPEWHFDTNATDLMNYFIKLETNSTRLIDPVQGLPQLTDVLAPLKIVHAKLFATWLAFNRDSLFDADKNTTITGQRLYKEERLLFHKIPFILSEIILGIYILTVIFMFIRCPTDLLPRLPNSMGAIIPYFAGSRAVLDFKGTSHMSTGERMAYMKEKGPFVYDYGKYAGSEGRMHSGIERMPFVTAIERRTEKSGKGWWKDWLKVTYRKVEQEHEE